MDDGLTNHQRLLMEIRDKLCFGVASELSKRIGKDSTYVNRLFYPVGKPGRKGIGLEIMQACNAAFQLPPGFWDMQSPAIDDELRLRLLKILPRLDYERMARNLRVHGMHDDFGIPAFSRSGQVAAKLSGFPTLQPILAWEHEDDLPEGEYVLVPRLNVHLSAGGGKEQVEIELAENTPLAFRSDWIRQKHFKPKKLAAMTASGRSMEPTIWHGDSLVIDTSQTDVVDGGVYALWYEGGERVKRLYRMPGGGLRIRSDNAAEHPEIVLGPEYVGHVRVIGRVVHRSGTGGL